MKNKLKLELELRGLMLKMKILLKTKILKLSSIVFKPYYFVFNNALFNFN